MSRSIKTIGLAVVAILAMTALASAAQAAEYHAANTGTTYLLGTQQTKNVFHTDAGTVKCGGATFEGTQSGESATTITVHPTYTECTAFGQAATVETGTCNYTFAQPTGSGPWSATVTIGCSSGNIKVNVPAGNCSLTVGAQSPTGSVTLENSGESVLVTSHVTGIAYTVTGPGTVCGVAGSHTGAEYTGSVLESGYANPSHTEQVKVWVG